MAKKTGRNLIQANVSSPNNRILTNQYTNGKEFFIEELRREYIGYYHVFANGDIYSGPRPSIAGSFELLPAPVYYDRYVNIDPNVLKYREASKKITDPNILKNPVPYYPQPTRVDYERTFFNRYVMKKHNLDIYYEVEFEEFKRFSSNSRGYNSRQYKTLVFPWVIAGNRLQVEDTNKKVVAYRSRTSDFKELGQFLKYNYLEFYKEWWFKKGFVYLNNVLVNRRKRAVRTI